MNEVCSLSKTKSKQCPFAFSSLGEVYCGIAKPSKHTTNRVIWMKACPKKTTKGQRNAFKE